MLGRRRARVVVLVALLAALLAGCAGGYASVTLERLVDEQDAWDGRRVEVTGVVASFDDPLHYWVEDEQQHRVGIQPDDGLDDLVGATVTVRGRFTFDEDRGRRITIDDLEQ